MDNEPYSTIREILGPLIGLKLVDITQHDAEEYAETKRSYVMLMFEDGSYVKFFQAPCAGDDEPAFEHNCGAEE